jgi:hypothetical protein
VLENSPFIDDFPMNMPGQRGFSSHVSLPNGTKFFKNWDVLIISHRYSYKYPTKKS